VIRMELLSSAENTHEVEGWGLTVGCRVGGPRATRETVEVSSGLSQDVEWQLSAMTPWQLDT